LRVMDALRNKEMLSISEVQEVTGIKNVFPLIKSLYLKNMIYTGEEMKERYHPKKKTVIRLHHRYHSDNELKALLDELARRASKQADVVLKYLIVNQEKTRTDKLTLQKTHSLSAPAIQSLLDKGILQQEERRVDRLDQPDTE